MKNFLPFPRRATDVGLSRQRRNNGSFVPGENDPMVPQSLVYRLTQDLQLDADSLEKALGENPPAPAPGADHLRLHRAVRQRPGRTAGTRQPGLLPDLGTQGRTHPAGSVVRDALKEKVDEIEAQQMRKVYKKERDQLKDEIVQTLLPRAFIRRSSTFAAIAPSLGLILVDSASAKKAEDLLSTLREALGSPAGTPC